ncbi:MAG: Gfo/Idh/MocA family oxidoreductase [Candidatus Nanopelagicales bacterium]
MQNVQNVRFAVIGTNWITGALIDAGRAVPGFEVVAVQSRTADRAATFADQYDIPQVHTDLASLAADDRVDAVYIASPNSLHAEQSIAMLRAGKHVLAEKPLGANAAEVEAMTAAARESDRLLMEAYVAPFEPNVRAIRAALPEVGQVRRVVLVKDQYSSRYDLLKSGQLPNAFNPRFAAGSLMDLGVYAVNLAIHLFDAPTSVIATGTMLPSGVDGQGTILLAYDGFEAVCLHSKIAPCGIGSQIAGESGVVTFDDCSVPTRVSLARRDGSTQDLTRPQSIHHMRYEVEEFVGLVGAGARESEIHPPARSLAAIRVLDEARRQVGVRFPADG